MKTYRMTNFNICFILNIFKLVNGMVLPEISTNSFRPLPTKDINNIKKITSKVCMKNYTKRFTIKQKTTLNHLKQFLVTLMINGELFSTKQKINLVQFLLLESDKAIAKINVDTESILKDNHQVDFRKEYENLENKHFKFKNKFEQRREKKWKKLKEEEKDSVSLNNESP